MNKEIAAAIESISVADKEYTLKRVIAELLILAQQKGFLLPSDILQYYSNVEEAIELADTLKKEKGIKVLTEKEINQMDKMDKSRKIIKKSKTNIKKGLKSAGDDYHEIYMREIKKYEVLSAEEEREVFKRLEKSKKRRDKDGSKKAIDEIIIRNLKFVVKIANRTYVKNMSLKDKVQEGNIGLIKSIKRFDYKRGYRFLSYARWWIVAEIYKASINIYEEMRVSSNINNNISYIGKESEEFEKRTGRKPSIDELSEKTGISVKKIENALDCMKKTNMVYIDGEIGNEERSPLANIIEDTKAEKIEEKVETDDLRDTFNEYLKDLTDREREIIEHRFGLNGKEPKTLEKTGEIFKVSREAIRQTEIKIKRKLRDCDKKKRKLKEYLRE